jgi:uncharacterized membrane protein (DUF2068 family)
VSGSEITEGVSPRARGVRAIVLYKLAKAVGQILLAALILVLVSTGYVERAHELAAALRDHLVHHWSIKLAEMMMRSLTAKRLWWIVAALVGDSILSAIEGWALVRGFTWGAWLVVAATSLLLPVEVIELAYRTTAGRVVLFFVNLAIVLYLLKQAMKEHHAQHQHDRRVKHRA